MIYRSDPRNGLKSFKISSFYIGILAKTCRPRLEGVLRVLSQESCNISLNVFHGLPMFSFEYFLRTGKRNKIAGSHVGTERGLGDHWGLVPGRIVDDGEGRVAECIDVVGFRRVFDVTPNAGFAQIFRYCRFSATIPCTIISTRLGCQRRRSERKTYASRCRRSWPLSGVRNEPRRRSLSGPSRTPCAIFRLVSLTSIGPRRPLEASGRFP